MATLAAHEPPAILYRGNTKKGTILEKCASVNTLTKRHRDLILSLFMNPPLPSILYFLQRIGDTPVLLDTKGTGGLPEVVLEAEDARFGSDLGKDALEGFLLLALSGDGVAVGVTLGRPSDLGDVLASGGSLGAHGGGHGELLSGEITGFAGGDLAGEEGVDLDGEDVDVVAQGGTLVLPHVDGLGGGEGDILGETGVQELSAHVIDVGGKFFGGRASVEQALVSNNDHGDRVLGCVLDEGLDLVLGSRGEGAFTGREEDAEDDLDAVRLACGNNVVENTAVSAIHADGGESQTGDLCNVALDFTGRLAVTVGGVGGVGDGPLVALGHDATGLAVGAAAVGRLARLAGFFRFSRVAGLARLSGLGGDNWGRWGRIGGRGVAGCRGSVRLLGDWGGRLAICWNIWGGDSS